jgi:hypothetical protein
VITELTSKRTTADNYLQAGGRSGGFIAKSLLETGRFNLTAITRPDSSSELPEGFNVVKASNDEKPY